MGKSLKQNRKPEWAPSNSGDEFASFVLDGVDNSLLNKHSNVIKKVSKLSADDYINGVKSGDLTILSRTITLIESNSQEHINQAQEVIKSLLPLTGKSMRIGITGAPGVGKSTFIDVFGSYLCEQGYKVAVLTIDPSSTLSKGSILGDKTRMENLSKKPNAFIRPSPSGGTLGGVARKTRESILICEASGFDVILIETIGVGQSEITVRSMVDFYMLLIPPGGGDELQGIKKGAVELADLLVVNKAEKDNLQKAKITLQSYKNALHYLQPATEGWTTEVILASALEETGIDKIWFTINQFGTKTKQSGSFDTRRNEQLIEWIYSMVNENLLNNFYHNPNIEKLIPEIEKSVLNGELTPTNAVNLLMENALTHKNIENE